MHLENLAQSGPKWRFIGRQSDCYLGLLASKLGKKASANLGAVHTDIQRVKASLALQDHQALPLLKTLPHKVTVGQQDVAIQLNKPG